MLFSWYCIVLSYPRWQLPLSFLDRDICCCFARSRKDLVDPLKGIWGTIVKGNKILQLAFPPWVTALFALPPLSSQHSKALSGIKKLFFDHSRLHLWACIFSSFPFLQRGGEELPWKCLLNIPRKRKRVLTFWLLGRWEGGKGRCWRVSHVTVVTEEGIL